MKFESLTISKRGDDAYDVSDGDGRIAAIRQTGDDEWIIIDECRQLGHMMLNARFASAREAFFYLLGGALA